MGLGRSVAKMIVYFLGTFIKPMITQIFRLYNHRIDRQKPLPPVNSTLLMLPAHELAKKIRSKEVEPTLQFGSFAN
jgi:hypothetical protein